MFVWLAMMTGARRGGLCALTWDRLDPRTGILHIRTSIAQDNGRTWEKDTKTHRQRRITLDQITIKLLHLDRGRCEDRPAALGVELSSNARMFSRDPDGSTWPLPDTVSQRYERMCKRLGWDLNIKELRHYSATELIAAGVDPRTVAGRLGHSGGGVTTLRVYSPGAPKRTTAPPPPSAPGYLCRPRSGRPATPPRRHRTSCPMTPALINALRTISVGPLPAAL